MGSLSDAKKRRFERNGFLVVDDRIGRDPCATARDVLWDHIQKDSDNSL